MKIVMAACVADILHGGHLNLIREAKKQGDFLILVPHPSYSVKKYKREPITDTDTRIEILRELKDVDLVMSVDKDDMDKLIKAVKPDVLVHGDDWSDFPGRKTADKLGIKVVLIPYTKGVSSSQLIKRCKDIK